jgi:hypothetical protein
MKEPKRYYCGNGEGMFEDNVNGHWVEYSEHKAIIEALTKQLNKPAAERRLLPHQVYCSDCGYVMPKSYFKIHNCAELREGQP